MTRSGETPLRVSDAQRDRVIAELREGYANGRLSHDTFLRRVDSVLLARFGDELGRPVADLRKPSRIRATVVRVGHLALRTRQRRLSRREASFGPSHPPLLALPTGTQGRYTIGREHFCDMTLHHKTVSRLHARLERDEDGWLLSDLGSTNGTRLNGWRVSSPSRVRAGDLVSFGATTFVLADSLR